MTERRFMTEKHFTFFDENGYDRLLLFNCKKTCLINFIIARSKEHRPYEFYNFFSLSTVGIRGVMQTRRLKLLYSNGVFFSPPPPSGRNVKVFFTTLRVIGVDGCEATMCYVGVYRNGTQEIIHFGDACTLFVYHFFSDRPAILACPDLIRP